MRLLIHALGLDMGGGVRHLTGLRQAVARRSDVEVRWLLREEVAVKIGLEPGRQLAAPRWAQRGVAGRVLFDLVLWRRYVQSGEFDCMVTMANHGLLTGGMPHVVLQQNALLFHPLRKKLYPGWKRAVQFGVQRFLALLSCRVATVVLCPCAALAELVAADTGRTVQVLPHAMDVGDYGDPLDAAVAAKIPAGGRTILFLGLGAPHKNLNVVLDAVARTAEPVTLLLTIGEEDGAVRSAVLARAVALGVAERVVLLGNVPGRQVGELLRRVDVVVNPTLVESFGFAALEGMAFGAAMVSSDIGPNREICGEAALYFSPENAGALAERLSEMLQPAVNAEYRRRAVARFREVGLDWDGYLERLAGFCREAMRVAGK